MTSKSDRPGPTPRGGILRFFVLIIDGMSIGQHALMEDTRN
jgi:hypothetical protein